MFPQVYLIELPADVKRLLSTFTVGVSFGLGSTDSVLTCLNLGGFLNQVSLLSTAAQTATSFQLVCPAKLSAPLPMHPARLAHTLQCSFGSSSFGWFCLLASSPSSCSVRSRSYCTRAAGPGQPLL
ncbi:hypothetical protein OAO87_01845 [bacterium]|nr:hypothetical protein [bacterium]